MGQHASRSGPISQAGAFKTAADMLENMLSLKCGVALCCVQCCAAAAAEALVRSLQHAEKRNSNLAGGPQPLPIFYWSSELSEQDKQSIDDFRLLLCTRLDGFIRMARTPENHQNIIYLCTVAYLLGVGIEGDIDAFACKIDKGEKLSEEEQRKTFSVFRCYLLASLEQTSQLCCSSLPKNESNPQVLIPAYNEAFSRIFDDCEMNISELISI
eukprot:TRINITY_DN10751_c0_g1_i1.p1 TRINITY_DN10751_c0_g1~~TRINITY_DN10751_c0_g1_i1.p1  ORF type:complete len:213 (+),score=30.72 TRINITY_DN10751_c0_g1_i1:3-641(+)